MSLKSETQGLRYEDLKKKFFSKTPLKLTALAYFKLGTRLDTYENSGQLVVVKPVTHHCELVPINCPSKIEFQRDPLKWQLL